MKKTVSILLCVCFLLGGILIGVLADSSLTTEASAASANDEIVGSWMRQDNRDNVTYYKILQFRKDGTCSFVQDGSVSSTVSFDERRIDSTYRYDAQNHIIMRDGVEYYCSIAGNGMILDPAFFGIEHRSFVFTRA